MGGRSDTGRTDIGEGDRRDTGDGGSDSSFCTQGRGSEMLSILQHNNVPERKFDTNRTLFGAWKKAG